MAGDPEAGHPSYIIFSLSMVSPWNGKASKSVEMKPVAESRKTKICLHVSCKNGLKLGDVLLPLLSNFALECAIRSV